MIANLNLPGKGFTKLTVLLKYICRNYFIAKSEIFLELQPWNICGSQFYKACWNIFCRWCWKKFIHLFKRLTVDSYPYYEPQPWVTHKGIKTFFKKKPPSKESQRKFWVNTLLFIRLPPCWNLFSSYRYNLSRSSMFHTQQGQLRRRNTS